VLATGAEILATGALLLGVAEALGSVEVLNKGTDGSLVAESASVADALCVSGTRVLLGAGAVEAVSLGERIPGVLPSGSPMLYSPEKKHPLPTRPALSGPKRRAQRRISLSSESTSIHSLVEACTWSGVELRSTA
jgi:hypothetical protein